MADASLQPVILVVDDAADVLKMVRAQLEQWGYRALTSDSGEDGLLLAAKHRPDLILLDMLLPKMRGREFCQRLQADPATAAIPAIFLTALAHDDYVRAGFDLGAEDYIVKPFEPSYLKERIRVCLLKRSKRAAGA
jgi:DNA-binding response OmpR family regulator